MPVLTSLHICRCVVVLLLCVVFIPAPAHSQTPCTRKNCPTDTTYCVEEPNGNATCQKCHSSCVGCDGPASSNCFACRIGFVKNAGDFEPCQACVDGFYGVNCAKECHCLNKDKCDKINGTCTDFICIRGYQNTPKCDTFCDQGTFGLECSQECHCPDGDTCSPINGDCSSGRCHPDYTGAACANRLPELALGPNVARAECRLVELTWAAFDVNKDIGVGPVGLYKVYKKLNGTDDWVFVRDVIHVAGQDAYRVTITSDLDPDDYYQFRVDIAMTKNGKISSTISPGNPSDLVFIPCTTTTTVQTTTEKVFSRNLFLDVVAVATNSSFIKLSWTVVSEFANYDYEVRLSRQFLGHGDCENKPGSVSTYGPYRITDTPIGFARLKPWGRYKITVSAVGVVVDVRDSKEVIATTAIVAPTGKVTNITTGRLEDKVAEIVWDSIPCDQRGGPLKFYEIAVLNLNQSEASELTYATSDKRLLLSRLSPYTTFSARIKYTNNVGDGPWSDLFYFQTEEEDPDSVTIISTTSTFSTITVTFNPVTVTSGVLKSYTVMFSLTADFAVSESKTIQAKVGVTSILIERLKEETKYYLKMAASTQTKTGSFGDVVERTTLKAPPPAEQISLSLTSRNTSCLFLAWEPPADRTEDVSQYELEVQSATADTSVQPIRKVFPGNQTKTYIQCQLEPSQLYLVTVRAVAVSGVISALTLSFSTDHGIPSTPVAPEFVRSSYTNITVNLEPVALSKVKVTSYQVKVQPRGTDNKTVQNIYIAAELMPQDIPKRIEFVVGDGNIYNGYNNTPLARDSYFLIFYSAMSTLVNKTTSSTSQLATAVRTVPFDPAVVLPLQISLTERTTDCLAFSWVVPDELKSIVTTFEVSTVISAPESKVVNLETLPGTARSYRLCKLSPFTAYSVTVATSGGMARSSEIFYTEQSIPQTPVAPSFVNSSYSTITVAIEPVAVSRGLDTSYQLTVEQVSSAGRRKRAVGSPPGYVTAQLSSAQIPQRMEFVVGDGGNYSGVHNMPLTREKFYIIHYSVTTRLYNVTKQSYASLSPAVQTVPYVIPTQVPVTAEDDSSDNGAVIGVIVALIIIVIIIIILFLVYLWWRRRNRFNPYEIQDNDKNNIPLPRFIDNYDPQKYWSPIFNIKDSRHIVVGRELVYAENPNSAMNGHAPDNPEMPKISFAQEFQNLPHRTKKATDNLARQNAKLNRFPHLLPYDHSLVQLMPDTHSRGTYINASFIPGYKKTPAYIAAQSPYDEETVLDFWRLIYQKNIKTIVMITNVVEDNIVKCTQYWPNQTKASYGNFLLHLISRSDFADYVIRTIGVKVMGSDTVNIVTLFEFTSWPDHGVPDDPIPFLEMRYKVRSHHGDNKTPILVHCGTGVARTGVFIAVDALIDQYASEGRVMVFDYVRRIRKDRPYMVRTQKQYVFIYETIFEEFHAGDTLVDQDLKGRYHNWTQKNSKTGNSFLKDQFHLLQQFTRGLTPDDSKTALLEVNLKKNRYLDVIPPEKHRPLLKSLGGPNATDYINAFYVDGYLTKNQFIITQSPLHTTIIDFWKLVYDYDICTIVMMENFKPEDESCGEYWPNVNLKQFEPFFIETKASYQEANITIRNFKILNTTRPKEPAKFVRQFQFNVWEDPNSTPHSKTMLLDLVDYVFDWQEESCGNSNPVLVHCKDGASHSGLFTAVAVCCERMEEDQEVDVYRTVKHMKRRRTQCIDDYDQFRFCYKSVWDFMNLRMQGGKFTESLGQNKTDKVYGVASLSLTMTNSYFDSVNTSNV